MPLPIVVVQLTGGLGNQMFQYAAGRAVADRLGVTLGLDVRPLRAPDSRTYGLGAFAIQATVVPDHELACVPGPQSWRWFIRRGWRERVRCLARRSSHRRLRPIVHQGVDFRDVLQEAGPNTWLCGWWQSERYFAAIADQVRADLTLKRASDETLGLARRIQALDFPVAVHVRRGDYASVPSTRAYHGLCSPEYYAGAMARVQTHRRDATFIFFSDEPEWVAQALRAPREWLVTANGAHRPEEDLHLMTCCRAHVIANSTFSWWGAWLADSAMTIAPARWFQAPGVDAPDIVPQRWLRL